jgi:hypothetical protein
MIELLKFFFSSFWIFIGFLLVLSTVVAGLTNIVANICRTVILSKRKKDDSTN